MLPPALLHVLADRYRVERELGAGGMATVYLAEDVKHRRKVAVKVLHPELSAVLGGERFLKEIELTASLQHPHILPLFDSGDAGGQLYYVMPFVEGETLRARLERERQLPIADVLQLAREIADALQYAHDRGIIHRDIKPENILLHGGHALVADFGIALAVQQAGGSRMTQTGLSLGTPQYMAPEQASGERTVDARADVYALGAVMYEMVAGEPPFTAPTMQGVIAKLMTEPPRPLDTLRRTVPGHVADAVHRALEKVPADRFPSARALAEALADGSDRPSAAARRPRTAAGGSRLVMTLGAALAATLAFAAWGWGRGSTTASALLYQFSFDPGPEVRFEDGIGSQLAITPDGRRIVFRGRDVAGRVALFARDLDDEGVRLISGTDSAIQPVLRSDALLFSVSRTLYRVPPDGGARARVGGDLGPELAVAVEGQVVLRSLPADSIYAWRRGAGDAQAELLWARPRNPDDLYLFSRPVPGGGGLFTLLHDGDAESGELGVMSPDGEMSLLGIRGTDGRYVAPGYLLWGVRGGEIRMAPFDARARKVTGEPMTVLRGAWVKIGGAVPLAVSENGTLAYVRSSSSTRLVLETPRGDTTVIGDGRQPAIPSFSPDGRWVAFDMAPPSSDFQSDGRDIHTSQVERDIWVYDLMTRTPTRVTTDGNSHGAEWSPDGAWLYYTAWVPDTAGSRVPVVRRVRADGSAPPQRVPGVPEGAFDAALAPDGRAIIVRTGRMGMANAFHLVSLVDTSSRVLFEGASLSAPTISPDGRWIAYASRESGRQEVFVRAFPSMEGRVQVSNSGGAQPRWSRGRGSLSYRAGNRLIAASISGGSTLTVGTRQVVSDAPSYGEANSIHHQYDVHPDGATRVVVHEVEARRTIHVIVGWMHQVEAQFRAR